MVKLRKGIGGRNALLLLLAGVVACALAARAGASGVDLRDVEDSASGSNSSFSSSSGEQEEGPKAWEKHGGFVLYFVVVVYICLGFELLISLLPLPPPSHPQTITFSQPQTVEITKQLIML